MAHSAPPSPPRHSPSHLYGAMWALLALAAAGYVGTLIYKPDLLGGTAKHPISNQESNKGERSLSKAVARLKRAKRNVRRLENEISRLKAIDAATAQNSNTLNIPASAKKSSKLKLPAARQLPKYKNTNNTRLSTLAAATKLRNPSKPDRLKTPQPINTTTINRKSASKLAARFSDAADQNGEPRISNPLNTGAVLAKLNEPASLASAAVKSTLPKKPLKNALKNVKIISKPAALKSPKPAAQKPAILIGKATRAAGKKFSAAKVGATKAGTTKVVKTVAIKVPRTKVKNKKTVVAASANALRKTIKIQTGSVNPKPQPVIRFGAPVVRRARAPIKVAIRLSAASSKAELQLNWLALKDRYGDILRGMNPRYETLGSTSANRRYRLLAGPMDSAARALSICDHFNAANIACTVSSFTGRSL